MVTENLQLNKRHYFRTICMINKNDHYMHVAWDIFMRIRVPFNLSVMEFQTSLRII